ncbi:MAG: hypothetical protein ABIA76_03745 [Candidatus Diapherotrites archaeon]
MRPIHKLPIILMRPIHKLPIIGRFFKKPTEVKKPEEKIAEPETNNISPAAKPLTETERNAAMKRYVEPKQMKPDVKPGEGIGLWGTGASSAWNDAVIKKISYGQQVPNSRKRTINFVFESEDKKYTFPREIEMTIGTPSL